MDDEESWRNHWKRNHREAIIEEGSFWESSERHLGRIWEASGRHLGSFRRLPETPGGQCGSRRPQTTKIDATLG